MNRKIWLIALGVVAVVLVCGAAAAALGVTAYSTLRRDPVSALAASVSRIENHEGILVACVEADSPADQAGLSRGDVITEIDGATVNGDAALYGVLGRAEPGDTLEMVVMHGDDRRELDVTLSEQDGEPYLGVNSCLAASWGQIFADQFALSGAVIVDVVPDSPADDAGLQAGDQVLSVDSEQVSSDQTLSDLISSHAPGDEVVLEIATPGEDPRNVAVTLGENPDQQGSAYLGVTYQPIQMMIGGQGIPFGESMGTPEDYEGFFQIFPHGYESELPEGFEWAFPEDGEWGRRFKFDFPFPEGFPEGMLGAVIVHQVTPDSPADQAGLEAGTMITEINGEPVEEVEAFIDQVRSMDPGDQLSLTFILPGEDETTTIDIELGEDPDEAGQAYLGISVAGHFFKHHFDEMDEGDAETPGRLPELRRMLPRLPFLRELLPQLPGLEDLPGTLQELLSTFDA
jgi:S1-C subfamily serine protease